MDRNSIFFPVLIQVLLTLLMYFLLGKAKARALKQGQVDLSRRALHADAWPDDVLKHSNNIANQFETPVLFYVLAGVAWAMDRFTGIVLILLWAYVVTRIAHAWIHCGSNYVPHRRAVFTLGCVVLLVLALMVLYSLFFSGEITLALDILK